MCKRAANPGECLCLVPAEYLFYVLLGDRVEASGAAVEGYLLRTIHVHNVNRVAVRLKTCS